MSEVAIKVDGISKSFKLPHEKHTSLKSLFVSSFKKRTFEKQKVLKDVSFEIKKGEFFGIVGRNGSGKSTLLKLLAGIYSPDKGHIRIEGKLTPFIELGVGFNPELTGRENVYLNGALLGFDRKDMDAMYDEIVEFAELEKFMDQKLKNYSSGMQVRLAFSIAIRAETEVLLIDEVLAVGDVSFQQKCYQVFDDLKKKNITIVLVTHDMSAVQRFCDRAMLISNGEIAKSGKPNDITDKYLELNYEDSKNTTSQNAEEKIKSEGTKIDEVVITGSKNVGQQNFTKNEKLNIAIEYTNQQRQEIHFGIQVYSDSGIYCFGTNSRLGGAKPATNSNGQASVSLELNLNDGQYYVTVVAMNESLSKVLDYKPKIQKFRVIDPAGFQGIVAMNHKWEVSDV